MTQTYVERFAQMVTEIVSNVKRRKSDDYLRFAYNGAGYDLADRTQRMALIDRLTDDYVAAHADVNQASIDTWIERGCKGERPSPITLDTALIDRLTDAILDEELTDTDAWKSQHSEYPFLSNTQMARRTDGVHQRKYESPVGEVKLSAARNVATDGRSYSVPARRERSNTENAFVDEATRSRNKQRRLTYDAFVGTQPVVAYTLTQAEMEARGWR